MNRRPSVLSVNSFGIGPNLGVNLIEGYTEG